MSRLAADFYARALARLREAGRAFDKGQVSGASRRLKP